MAKAEASKVKLRTPDQRPAGRRAQQTRERILAVLRELLDTMPYRDIRVTDIVREVGTSPATFYQYFADVEAAVLSIAQDTARDGATLKSLGEGSWSGKAGAACADRLVNGVVEFWREHEAVLRVIDTAAREGDGRFRRARTQLLNQIAVPLAEAGGNSTAAKATAAALVGMLAHAGAQRGPEIGGVASAEVRTALARLVHWGVTGRKMPG